MASPATSSHLPALAERHEREAFAHELQSTMQELVDLSLIGEQLHWAVVGTRLPAGARTARWARRVLARSRRRGRRARGRPRSSTSCCCTAAAGARTANAQLRAFRRAADQLADLDIRVVALSVDDEATTRQTIAKHGLEFPVGHDADADTVAAATGAFVNDAARYLQSTGFVLDPGGGSSSASTPAAR
jgi:hypothetical protein